MSVWPVRTNADVGAVRDHGVVTRIACPAACGWDLEFDLTTLVGLSDADLHVQNGLCAPLEPGHWAGVVDDLVVAHVRACEPLRRFLWQERRVNWRSFIERARTARQPAAGRSRRRHRV